MDFYASLMVFNYFKAILAIVLYCFYLSLNISLMLVGSFCYKLNTDFW